MSCFHNVNVSRWIIGLDKWINGFLHKTLLQLSLGQLAPHSRLIASFSKFICSIQIIDIINQDLQIEYFNESTLTTLLSITDNFKYSDAISRVGAPQSKDMATAGWPRLDLYKGQEFCYHVHISPIMTTWPLLQCVPVVPVVQWPGHDADNLPPFGHIFTVWWLLGIRTNLLYLCCNFVRTKCDTWNRGEYRQSTLPWA
jgi:hypothetical protein